MTAPYVAFHGIQIDDIVDIDGVEESGGGRVIDSHSLPSMDYAGLVESGRDMVTYSFSANSSARADIDELVDEINNSPGDVEFYPREADRCVYATYAQAGRTSVTKHYLAGVATNKYNVDATVYCRAANLLGNETTAGLLFNVDLPYTTASITNNGYHNSPPDYVYVSGDYDAATGFYANSISLEMGTFSLRLCDQLLRGDSFELDRYGSARHIYETDFPKLYSEQQIDLLGSTYCDYGTGGSITHEELYITNSGKILIPFFGPLAVSGNPALEFEVLQYTGEPVVSYGFDASLEDIEEVDYTIIDGKNTVGIPNAEGEDFVFFGITTDDTASIKLKNIKGTVDRYLSIDDLPYAEPGDSFTIGISDGEFSSHSLRELYISYRDEY